MPLERIVPGGMKASSEQVTASEATKQTSRVENLSPDKCPICFNTFRISEANGIPVLVCDAHSIVMPLKDRE